MWLWESIAAVGDVPFGSLHTADATVRLADLTHRSSLSRRLDELRGRSVLIATQDQLTAALACIELDGVARRIVLCPPGVARGHLPGVIKSSGADTCVRDSSGLDTEGLDIPLCVTMEWPVGGKVARRHSHDTEWVLLTSGTTGTPKLVLHRLAGLNSALAREPRPTGPVVWGTFYDIRRYGGLQILLRALRTGSLVLASPGEPVPDFLARAGSAGVTHISGTPSHWRSALMSGATARIRPRYVRLSGEIADQAILDNLRAAYPEARVAHAFATTEAGVAFEVGDGLAGFPATLVGEAGADPEMRIVGNTLRIRSAGNAEGYLGEGAAPLKDRDGFVDTGDRVELRNGRYYFIGRSGGVINVGGLKVHPEEVEAAINSHPWVWMSLVRARRSPITGALVAADVVLSDRAGGQPVRPPEDALSQEILETCRRTLEPYKVPAIIRFVPALEVSASGKLVRPNA
jgi:acyl-coenzyme A synthetase/AMP-(fatty) acid ligase